MNKVKKVCHSRGQSAGQTEEIGEVACSERSNSREMWKGNAEAIGWP